jgi:predicted transport protein
VLESLITSKTRIRLLVKFFISTANSGHLRGLATEFNESTNAIRKELNHLTDAGYLEKKEVSNKIAYRANTNHPMFTLLQQVVHKYIGLDVIVENIIDKMGSIDQIQLVGDYANGVDSGMIEVNIIGAKINRDYTKQLIPKIEGLVKRRIHFYYNQQFKNFIKIF